MIGIDKIIISFFLSVIVKCTELYVVDSRAMFDPNSRTALEIFPGADVYVGEYMIENTSIDYYVNIVEPITGDKVSLNASQQVKYGVEALVDKYNVTPVVMTYHYKNKHLRREIGHSERHSKHVQGNFKVVLKYGEKAVSRPLIGTTSSIEGNIISTYLTNILHTKGENGKYIEEIRNTGKSWEKNIATISMATCAMNNEKCDIEAVSKQIKQAAAWMDRTIDKYPYGRTYEMNFCLKIVRNDTVENFSELHTLVQDLESPKGHYDGERLDIAPYDEL